MLRLLSTLTGVDLAVKSPPLRRVLSINWNIFEGDGEVNEVEVEVLNAPELELVPDELVGLTQQIQHSPNVSSRSWLTRSFLW